MFRITLTVLLLMLLTRGGAQPFRLADLYPSPGKIGADKISLADPFLASGCAEGNCRSGTGKYITVKFSPQGSYQDKEYGQLLYTIYSGEFNETDSSFRGQCLELALPVTMKKGKSAYAAETKPDFSLARLIANGSFKQQLSGKEKQTGYIRHGWVEFFNRNKKKHFDYYDSFTGFYQQDRPLFARIRYPQNYSEDCSQFTGIVSAKGKPVMGLRIKKNGEPVNFGLYNGGAAEIAPALYDTSLLFALVQHKAGPASLRLTIPDDAGGFFLTSEDRAFLKTYRIDNGILIQAGGAPTPAHFTGQGIFYHPDGKLYAGGFRNGEPDGEGWLFIDEDSQDKQLKKYEHRLWGQFSAGLIVDALYGAADSGTEPNLRRLASPATIQKAWAALQTKAESGDAEAMYDYAWKFFGNNAPEPNPARALEWLEKSARAGHLPAITELVGVYSGEKAYHRSKDVFPANPEKRAFWAGEICRRDKALATKQNNALEPSYYQLYWNYYFSYLVHRAPGGTPSSNQPFLPLEALNPEKEKFLKWVNDDIKKDAAAGQYYSVRVSNYTVQPLAVINDTTMKFNVVAYHYGKLPYSLEFSISKFNRTVKEGNNIRTTESSRNSLVCRFDKEELKFTGQYNKRSCRNGSLAYVFKNTGLVADYFFNLTPTHKPELKVYTDFNKQGFYQPVAGESEVIWVIYFYK